MDSVPIPLGAYSVSFNSVSRIRLSYRFALTICHNATFCANEVVSCERENSMFVGYWILFGWSLVRIFLPTNAISGESCENEI